MKKHKICMGCFSEWEEDLPRCGHCGWSPGSSDRDGASYKAGDILGKRYLLGSVYLETDYFLIRRVFDNVTRVICFILYQKNQDESSRLISLAATHLLCEEKENGKGFVFLSMKPIGGKTFLFFSMRDRFMDPEKIEKLIEIRDDEKEQIMRSEESDLDQEDSSDTSQDTDTDSVILPPHTVLDGHYVLLGCIGIGGFGISYLANDRITGRSVAIKEYFPSQWAEREDSYVNVKSSKLLAAYRYGMETFLKEIRITASLIHTKGVVTLYDAFYENDTIYMVMDYVQGISVGRELKKRDYQPYTPEETRDILVPVIDALAAVHEKKILHSDISPGNFMRTEEGEVILIDFGAAKYMIESQPLLLASFLKLDYASPEQYRTAKEGIPTDEGPWTDVYSLGATMFYMMTGHKPLDVNNRLSSSDTGLFSSGEWEPDLPEKWMCLIQSATELDRKKRIQSMQEFRERLMNL